MSAVPDIEPEAVAPLVRPARRTGLAPSWPLVVGLAAFLRALADRLALLSDPDTYLHIAAGRWMLAHLALPTHDPFSHSLAGAAWTPHEWLAELIIALVYNGLGWGGLVVVTAACFGVALAVLTRRLLDHAEPISALIAAVAGGMLVLPHLLARPHILALPVLVLWSAEVIRARDAGRVPSLWLLPAMVLWANLHGGFMFGLALAGFLAGEALIDPASRGRRAAVAKGWAIFLLASVLAALATPNGIDGFLLPFRIMGMTVMQSVFIEWQSPNFQGFQLIEVWLIGLLFVVLCGGFKLRWTRAILLLGLLHMTLQHVRHADLLGLVGPLAIAGSLGPQIARRVRSNPDSPVARGAARLAAPASAAALALVLAIGIAAGGLSLLLPVVRPDSASTPGAALAAAQRLGLTGKVFNEEAFGGYLIFRGVPSFIDGRTEMYGDAFLQRYLDAEGGKEPALEQLLAKYGIAWTLLPPDCGAARLLDRLPGWRRVYADKFAVIHVRVDASH